jgi:hypothetical protein
VESALAGRGAPAKPGVMVRRGGDPAAPEVIR